VGSVRLIERGEAPLVLGACGLGERQHRGRVAAGDAPSFPPSGARFARLTGCRSMTIRSACSPIGGERWGFDALRWGEPRSDDRERRGVAPDLLLRGAVLVLVVGAVTWIFVGCALAPVETSRREVASIGDRKLDRRVPGPGVDDEVRPAARTMNAMLERLEVARHRQREFAADASHELRSPLTSIRAQIELDLVRPDEADLLATERLVCEKAGRLERLANDLLQLARGDLADPVRRDPVDLDDGVFEETARLSDRTGVAFDVASVSGSQLLGDGDELARAGSATCWRMPRGTRARWWRWRGLRTSGGASCG